MYPKLDSSQKLQDNSFASNIGFPDSYIITVEISHVEAISLRVNIAFLPWKKAKQEP